jgi:hypothetical protein
VSDTLLRELELGDAVTAPAKTKLLELVLAETAIVDAYDHVPPAIRAFPAVTLAFLSFTDEDHQTGPLTKTTYSFAVAVYVKMIRDYREPQLLIEALVPQLLRVARAHPDLDFTCERARIADQGEEVEIDSTAGWVLKTLRLTLEYEEGV